MQGNNPPNAAQARWLKHVAELFPGNVIHHPAGRTAKHNKIHIGHWWIIPMRDLAHKQLHNEGATFGSATRKEYEKTIFKAVLASSRIDPALVPPQEVVDAIEDYHR